MEKHGEAAPLSEAGYAQLDAERLERTTLTKEDTWLVQLGVPGEEIDNDWIQETNQVIAVAITDLKRVGNTDREQIGQVQAARERFFNERLGLSGHNTKLTAALTRFVRQHAHKGRYPSPFAFIANCKSLAAIGVDLSDVPGDVLFTAVADDLPLFGDLFASLGIPFGHVLKNAPFLAVKPYQKIAAQVSYIQKAVAVLDYGETAGELIRTFPRILQANRTKLRLLGQIAADHGNREKSSNLKSPFGYGYAQPPAAHLIAIASHDVYEPRHAKFAAVHLKEGERREKLLSLLNEKENRSKVGSRIISLYFELEPLTDAEREAYPALAGGRGYRISEILAYGVQPDDERLASALEAHTDGQLEAALRLVASAYRAKKDLLSYGEIQRILRHIGN